ncbi:hypothetical protein [Zoogloea sp.]|uniref:hypothetical protein n=1 Tax=Zoogloea sp. TaxID=49181 RepID=UPI0035AF392E
MSTQDHPKPGVRNRYYRHKAMKAEDFRQEQDYLIERRRLINRTVIGWGVVRGLTAELKDGGITVTQGFGLDRAGREIVVIDGVQLTTRNTFVQVGTCFVPIANTTLDSNATYRLRIHFAERHTGDAYLPDSGCGEPEYRYTEETVVFSLSGIGDCNCPSAEDQKAHVPIAWKLSPGKSSIPQCSDDLDLCDKHELDLREDIVKWESDSESFKTNPTTVGEFRKVDWNDGLAIADIANAQISLCGRFLKANDPQLVASRRSVKSNDLLYDLVRKRSLTTITDISWKDLHFKEIVPNASNPIDKLIEIFSNDLTIKFSRNVAINDYCIKVEFDVTWRNDDIANNYTYSLIAKDNTSDSCKEYTFKFDTDWLELAQQITRRFNRNEKNNYLELKITIEIFGDLILDEYGQAVDASNRGIAPPTEECPTGNGTPGGTFRSVILFTNKQADGATS